MEFTGYPSKGSPLFFFGDETGDTVPEARKAKLEWVLEYIGNEEINVVCVDKELHTVSKPPKEKKWNPESIQSKREQITVGTSKKIRW